MLTKFIPAVGSAAGPGAGGFDVALTIPPSFVGLAFHHQVLVTDTGAPYRALSASLVGVRIDSRPQEKVGTDSATSEPAATEPYNANNGPWFGRTTSSSALTTVDTRIGSSNMSLSTLRRLLAAALCSVLCSSPATAGLESFFVDVATGSDANDGLTSATAWKTIGHALEQMEPGVNIVYVAPGTYSAASGEVFPLRPRSVYVVGTGDEPEDVIIDAGGESVALSFDGTEADIDVGDGLENLVVRGGDPVGIDVISVLSRAIPDFRNVVVRGCSTGLSVFESEDSPYTAWFSLSDGTVVEDCGVGVLVSEHASFSAIDARFRGNGIGVHAFGRVIVLQSVVTSNEIGLRIVENAATSSGTSAGSSYSMLIARNAMGVHVTATDQSAWHFDMEDMTISDNDVGIALDGPGVGPRLKNSIVWGNGDDYLPLSAAELQATYCDFGDGDFAGGDGNLSVDPLFIDSAAGDYRLAPGSPCAEVGGSGGNVDLLGRTRPIDGDLNAHAKNDLGAYELATLVADSSVTLGGTLSVEGWNLSGAGGLLFASPLYPVDGLETAFGSLKLDLAAIVYVGTVTSAPGPPAVTTFPVPAAPGLAGTTVWLQGVLASDAPAGGAWTNAESVELLP